MTDVHNALHRYGNVVRALSKLVGGGGVHDVAVERLGETLTPVIDPWRHPEFLALADIRTFMVSATVAAGGAGFNSILYLNNPAGSRLIAVVRGVWGDGGAAALAVSIFEPATAKTGGTPANEVDFRQPLGGSRCLVESVNGEAQPAGNGLGPRMLAPANDTKRLVEPGDYFVVPPGSSLGVVAITTNVLMNASILWTERAALPGELD